MASALVDRVRHAFTSAPWLHWVVAYGIPMGFYGITKLAALPALASVYAALSEHTVATAVHGMALAACEDVVTTTLLLATLYILEGLGRTLYRLLLCVYGQYARVVLDTVSVVVYVYAVFVVTALWLAPVAADLLLVRTTRIRFSRELLAAYVREHALVAQVELGVNERRLAAETTVGVIITTLLFTITYTVVVDLSAWSPTALLAYRPTRVKHNAMALVQPIVSHPVLQQEDAVEMVSDAVPVKAPTSPLDVPSVSTSAPAQAKRRSVVLALLVLVFTIATRSVVCFLVGPAVGAIARNATLNEIFVTLFRTDFQPSAATAILTRAADYIHSDTEDYTLFQDNSLFRRTKGFKGPLAFDVTVDQNNLPNVLVIAVESFRFADSAYLTQAEADAVDAASTRQRHRVQLTPQFDRWAQRGIAFPNMWSSWQTSRSLESLLFGHVPLDAIASSGTTTGRVDTPLVGLPQFFKQKGYETAFTTGTRTDYDQWNTFLPTHGFDTVLGADAFQRLAETHLGVRSTDWHGKAHRGFEWGVHDDLAFEILSVLIASKVQQQQAFMARGAPRHPFFLTHYTISSHTPYDAYPAWFNTVPLPDFTPLCEPETSHTTNCERVQQYAKLRFFTDMMLGKFLDVLEAKGLLKDMIVVIVGDHGQTPEQEHDDGTARATDKTHVAGALIAEGRLGTHAGTIIRDAVEHYDLLNTLADIVGVPDEGFVQTGVGRSLKRAVPFGTRTVWSNDPLHKLAAVRGHQRLVYDRLSNAMGLYDTITDPFEHDDLLPTLTEAQRAEWLALRTAGRKLNAYFKHRWDRKCIAQIDCDAPKKKHHNS